MRRKMDNTVGDNVKRLRIRNGWIQAEMATKLKISIPAYSKIETGLTEINIARLHRLSDIFNVGPSEILFRPEELVKQPLGIEAEELKTKISGRDTEIVELQRKLISLYEIVLGMIKKI
ncbi:helix-turn-helix domain-containing protein [Pedobacter sp. AW31-3R]|uniref:helix-turn-helix domain-containing protein n=1 Tax=Pedobacter sp. AW31-3R TaxID=3445781 RepID=UPI003F9EF6CB